MRTTLIETDGDTHDVTIAAFHRDVDSNADCQCNQFEFVHSDEYEFDIGQIVEVVTTNDMGETEVFHVRCLVSNGDSSTWQVVSDTTSRYEWLEKSLAGDAV